MCWADCADVQAGLTFCCSQTPEDRFSRVEAQIMYMYTQQKSYWVTYFLSIIFKTLTEMATSRNSQTCH